MDLHVQKFLRSGGSLQDLETKYAIKARQHLKYKNLWCLKYSMIESDFNHEIVRECRGLILDSDQNWAVKRIAFHKFFNHGEIHAAPIDWSTARVEEKVDGSLMSIYWHDGHWEVASSGTPDGSGNVMNLQGENQTKTFADLFWETFKKQGLRLPDDDCFQTSFASDSNPREMTWSFELCTDQNRVLVQHPENIVVLIGIRHNDTGREYRTTCFGHMYPIVKTFPLQSLEDCLKAAEQLDPMKQEGYVLVNADFSRVKIKTSQYVHIAHLRDSKCSPARLLEVIRANEGTEFLAYFPEWKPLYETILGKFQKLGAELDAEFLVLKDIPVQKDFALQALKSRCSGALFQLRQGRVQKATEFLRNMTLKNLAGLLNLGDVEEKAPEE